MRGDGFGVWGDVAAVRCVPGEVLRDLLASWGRDCAELGLDLAVLRDAEIGPALGRLLGRGRGRLPWGLVDALDRIDDIADARGFDALATRLDAGGSGHGWALADLTPLGLAARMWVAQHARFEEVEMRRRAERAVLLREYPVRAGATLRLPPEEAAARLQEGVGQYWEARGRSDYCRAMVFKEEGRLYVPIHRGEALRTESAIDGGREGAVTYRPRAADLATYDERTGRLKVRASDGAARAEYRCRLGEVLFGDATAVEEAPVVSLAPLVERGREALIPTPGLREVSLVAARVAIRRGRRTVLDLASPDVLASLEELGLPELADCDLLWVKLLLRFPKGHRRRLELAPPNEIAFDRRRDEHVVERFLEERGFVLPPPGGPPLPPRPRTPQLGLFG